MGTQIWFREDIANAIRAAGAASLGTCDALQPAPNEYGEGYRAGIRTALQGLATAFGLPAEPKPPQVLEFRREEEEDRWRP